MYKKKVLVFKTPDNYLADRFRVRNLLITFYLTKL